MKLKKMLLGTIIGIILYSCISVVAFANTEEVRVYDVDTETTSITTFSYSGNETADEELLEPSYGTVGQESADPEEDADSFADEKSVIGSDVRTRVNNTTKVPYRWTAYLEATWKDGSVTTGTAFMVGINSAVTAAHNVYNTNKGGYAKKVLFWPGRNENATPYSGSHVKKIYVPKIYKSENQTAYDCAVLKTQNALGKTTGYFGIRKQAKDYGRIVVCIPGYPAEYSKQMWKAKGSIAGSSQNLFSYKLSTSAGQSGSPITRVYYGQWYALGVHTTGAESVNIGTRFGNYLYNFVKSYR